MDATGITFDNEIFLREFEEWIQTINMVWIYGDEIKSAAVRAGWPENEPFEVSDELELLLEERGYVLENDIWVKGPHFKFCDPNIQTYEFDLSKMNTEYSYTTLNVSNENLLVYLKDSENNIKELETQREGMSKGESEKISYALSVEENKYDLLKSELLRRMRYGYYE